MAVVRGGSFSMSMIQRVPAGGSHVPAFGQDVKQNGRALRQFLNDRDRGLRVDSRRLTVEDFLINEWLPSHTRLIRANTAENYRLQIAAYVLSHRPSATRPASWSPSRSALRAARRRGEPGRETLSTQDSAQRPYDVASGVARNARRDLRNTRREWT